MIQVTFSFNNAVDYSKMINRLLAGIKKELSNKEKCVKDLESGWKISQAAAGMISILSSITEMESPLFQKAGRGSGMWAWSGVLMEFLDSAERISSGINPR